MCVARNTCVLDLERDALNRDIRDCSMRHRSGGVFASTLLAFQSQPAMRFLQTIGILAVRLIAGRRNVLTVTALPLGQFARRKPGSYIGRDTAMKGAVPRTFFLPRMNTDFHGSSQGDVVGQFEARMDTNRCSSGFPARDLSCCVPGNDPEAMRRRLRLWWLTRSREVARENTQVRSSAGEPRMFFSPRIGTDFHG